MTQDLDNLLKLHIWACINSHPMARAYKDPTCGYIIIYYIDKNYLMINILPVQSFNFVLTIL